VRKQSRTHKNAPTPANGRGRGDNDGDTDERAELPVLMLWVMVACFFEGGAGGLGLLASSSNVIVGLEGALSNSGTHK